MGKFLILGMMGLLLGSSWLLRQTPAFGSADFDYAMATAPQGILLSDYFVPGSSPRNRARVVKVNNQHVTNTEAVYLTDDRYQVGSLWSNDNNTFDLDQPQTISMWLYFGDGAVSQKGKYTAGDGMAFVLQNDAAGTEALTQYTTDPPFGEALGVWGSDGDATAETPAKVAQTAIQKSWALEFDSFVNTEADYRTAGNGSGFDADETTEIIKYPHIASNYPGDVLSYTTKRVYPIGFLGPDFSRFRHVVALNHQGLIQGTDMRFLSDAQWHHITLKYQPAQDPQNPDVGAMQYIFDDKDPETGATLAGHSATVAIDKRKLVTPGQKATARWGFTGSTGANFENNLVIFDQVPDLVDATASVHVKNLTQQQSVTAGSRVTEGDQLQLDYQVTYLKGTSDWHDVIGKIALPPNLTPRSGTLTLADGTQLPLTASDFQQNTLSHNLATKLTAANPTVRIRLVAQVNGRTGTVAPVTSHFYGKEAVAEATLPTFVVVPRQKLALSLAKTKFAVADGQRITLAGVVNVLDSEQHQPNVHLRFQLNGRSEPALPNKPLGVLTGRQHNFSHEIHARLLKKGVNELWITAVDDAGHESPAVKATIFLGDLHFGELTTQVAYQTALTGRPQRLLPQEPVTVTIADSRAAGSNHWRLTAQAVVQHETTQEPLAGQLIYVTPQQQVPLTSDAQLVASHLTDSVMPVTTVVGESGQLQLQIRANAKAGHYQGAVTWTLANAE